MVVAAHHRAIAAKRRSDGLDNGDAEGGGGADGDPPDDGQHGGARGKGEGGDADGDADGTLEDPTDVQARAWAAQRADPARFEADAAAADASAIAWLLQGAPGDDGAVA